MRAIKPNQIELQTACGMTFMIFVVENLLQIGCGFIVIVVVDNDGIIVMMIELTMSIMSIIV